MADETYLDQTLTFSIPDKHCRGRAVRLGPVLDEILSAHAYPDNIRDLLAEAVCLTAMMGSLLKDEESQVTLQAQTEAGVISLLACDYKNGDLRGYVQFDREQLALQPLSPSLMALLPHRGRHAVRQHARLDPIGRGRRGQSGLQRFLRLRSGVSEHGTQKKHDPPWPACGRWIEHPPRWM